MHQIGGMVFCLKATSPILIKSVINQKPNKGNKSSGRRCDVLKFLSSYQESGSGRYFASNLQSFGKQERRDFTVISTFLHIWCLKDNSAPKV